MEKKIGGRKPLWTRSDGWRLEKFIGLFGNKEDSYSGSFDGREDCDKIFGIFSGNGDVNDY